MRRWILIVAVIAAVPLAWQASTPLAADSPTGANGEDRRPHVQVERPKKKTIYRVLDIPGEVLPDQQAGIYSRVQGYIASVHVDRGSWVKENDPLIDIAVPDLEAKLARQTAQLALCGPSRARDEATLAWRKSAYERLSELQAKSPNLVNMELLEEARGKYEIAKAELDLTVAKEQVLKAEVAETQSMVDLAKIRAPFPGVISERWADPGDIAQPGTTKILQLVRVDPVRVRVAVPEVDVSEVRTESEAEVKIDEVPGWSVRQKIARLFWALNRSTKTMYVEMDIPNPDRRIRPGMFAHVRLDLESHVDVLVLPAGSLVAEKKKTFVYVVKDGVAKKLPIVIGADTGIEFEVAKGVGPEDDVIVSGKNMVFDGMAVRVTKKE